MNLIDDALRNLLQRHPVRIGAGVLILSFFVLHATQWVQWPFISRLENIAYDARLVLTMPRTQNDNIVIVNIDEKSLAAEGRWPWSRDKLARMVEQLGDRYKARIVGFDVVFAEREENSGLQVLDRLRADGLDKLPGVKKITTALREGLDHDRQFARALRGRPIVLGYFFSDRDESGGVPKVGLLPAPVFTAGQFAGRRITFVRADGYTANLPELQRNALDAGHLVSLPDVDGIVRRVPMLYEQGGNYYEALSLAVARRVLGADKIRPGFPEQSQEGRSYSAMEWLQVGSTRIPVDSHVRSLVPYRGPQGSFPYVSATDVIHGKAPLAVLRDRIVLVGTTAKGLLDLRATPVAPDFPGVEVHANLIAGILAGTLMDNPAYTVGAETALLVISGLIMVVVLPLLSPLWAALATVGLIAGMLAINLTLWHFAHLVFPLANGLSAVLVLFLFNMSYGFFVEARGKRQLAGRFGQYVPPELVDEMSANPRAFSMDSESRELTVLFSDVRGFTTISEGLTPPELSRLMNEFLTPMTGIIHQHRGTIDKYMGDAIMAFWGAPLADPEHARHALLAGFEMLERVHRLSEEFQARGWPAIRIGVGLNTGPMNVGNMGSEFRVAYTVMGDAVNLGSRLEGLTKAYGVECIVGEATRAAVDDFTYRELDRVRVKGKDEPVTIYEPLGPSDSLAVEDRNELKLYRQALKLYRGQDWDLAELQFLNLKQRHPERALYGLYAERVAHFRTQPPGADWDGVFTHLSK